MNYFKSVILSFLLLFSTEYCTAQKFCKHYEHNTNYAALSAQDARTDSFDILKYWINLSFPNVKTNKKLEGNTVLRVVKLLPSASITLDLLDLNVDYSLVNGMDTVNFSYNGEKITADVSAVNVGDTFRLEIGYNGTPKQDSRWGGFYFSGDYAFNLGVGFDADPHNYGRVWFPCFDNFTDRALYAFNIQVDSGLVAMCNGELTGTIPLSGGSTIYHWDMSEPIPTYLASVAIAPYELIESNYSGIPTVLASIAADTNNMKMSFENLPLCIDGFVSAYGAHSFDRIGFNMVPFNGGAMEHATNIAYPLFGIAGGSKNYETLYAHELAHHWWGNTVTCRTQEDMWINEGWASFSERIFLEAVYGKEAYKDDIRTNHKSVVHYAHIRDGQALPVSGIGHANTYGMHVYDKGADMVHTLRGYMGDSAFFAACESFQQNFKFQDVSTEDLRDHFQQFTSFALNDFFEQWIKTAGFPQFYILSTEENSTNYVLRIKQNQRFNSIVYENVVYEITVFSADFESATYYTVTSGSDYTINIPKANVPFTPVYWALDFNEKISDAITDQWTMLSETGDIIMNEALFTGKVNSISDSALFRVEHHWVSPDQYFNKIPGLAMSKERYWNIDGIWPQDFELEGVFKYNGLAPSNNPAAGFLDNELIKITEDSLVLLYRPNGISDWQIHPNYNRNTGSLFNKVGEFIVPNLQKGQYTFGIYDHNLLSTETISHEVVKYKVFPIPADSELNIVFEDDHDCCLFEITNSLGAVVLSDKIKSKHKEFKIDVSELEAGVYFIGVVDGNKAYERRRIVIQ